MTGFIAACGAGSGTPRQAAAPETPSVGEIRIALLIDDSNPRSGVVFEDFRSELEEYIGIPVTVIEGATHLVGIEAMRAGNLDIMWGSPFVYLLAQRDMDVVRLAVTENPASINKAVFITSRDDIHTVADLEGKSFAFISAASSSGFLYPMYHLMGATGLDKDELLSGAFFSTVTYSGGQDASIMGVIHGDFDAAAVGNLNLQSIIASGMIAEDDVRIIGSSEIIPFPGYIAGAHLPDDLLEKIRGFMLSYDNEEYFGQRFGTPDTRFVLPDESQILHLMGMVEALDIDLEAQ